MTTHYNLHLVKLQLDFKITYRDGKFRKLEHLRGAYKQETLNVIGRAFPKQESHLEAYKEQYKGKVVFTDLSAKKEATLYSKFNNEWFAFYRKNHNQINYKFTGADGTAIKQIIKYLIDINKGNEAAALENWKLILSNWSFLPDFYKKQTDLKKINSNFNVIITELTESIRKKTGASHTESVQAANDIANKYF